MQSSFIWLTTRFTLSFLVAVKVSWWQSQRTTHQLYGWIWRCHYFKYRMRNPINRFYIISSIRIEFDAVFLYLVNHPLHALFLSCCKGKLYCSSSTQGEIFEASIEMKVKRGNHNERLINYMDEFDDVTLWGTTVTQFIRIEFDAVFLYLVNHPLHALFLSCTISSIEWEIL